MFVFGYCFVYLMVMDILYKVVIVLWLDCYKIGYMIDEFGVGV